MSHYSLKNRRDATEWFVDLEILDSEAELLGVGEHGPRLLTCEKLKNKDSQLVDISEDWDLAFKDLRRKKTKLRSELPEGGLNQVKVVDLAVKRINSNTDIHALDFEFLIKENWEVIEIEVHNRRLEIEMKILESIKDLVNDLCFFKKSESWREF